VRDLPSVINPEGWPKPKGYANAVVAEGQILVIAGQIGWDPVTKRLVSDDFVGQARQALANVVTVLQAAGGKIEHLVRMTWYITDPAAYRANLKEIGRVYRGEVGRYYPAMSVVVVAGLLEPGARVEIEATAVIHNGR